MRETPFGNPKYAEIEKAYQILERADDDLKREFFAYWINAMQEAVDKWHNGNAKDNPLEPFHELANIGAGQLAHLFRRITGYVPHDFLDMYAASHSPMGRERVYSQEDNIFFAVFIEEMVRRKSGLTQAIELLYHLFAKTEMSPEGLRKQMRNAYKESQHNEGFWKGIGDDRVVHILHCLFTYCDLPEKTPPATGPFTKAIIAYRGMIADVLEELKTYLPLVEKYDAEAKKGTFKWVFQAVRRNYDDPIDFIHSNFAKAKFISPSGKDDEWRKKRYKRVRELFDMYHSAKYFKETKAG